MIALPPPEDAAAARARKAAVAGVVAAALGDPLFQAVPGREWQMQLSERAAILYLLEQMRPAISIEIGTARCGSLRPIAAASRMVYTLDLDAVAERHDPAFANVNFVAGDSAATLPPLIRRLDADGARISFILVDGSHDEEGVRADLANCLRYRPRGAPTLILIHDSANPAVRAGIRRAPWQGSPHVHILDLDFVPGMLHGRADIRGELWGGLALAVLLPEPRVGEIVVQAGFDYARELLLRGAAATAPGG